MKSFPCHLSSGCLYFIALAVFILVGIACPVDVKISLNTNKTYQVIEGFGASGAWWAQAIGGWPEDKKNKILELLYSDQGIALNIYRYNIGAGQGGRIRDPWRRTECFETGRGEYDFSRDSNAVSVMKQVCRMGVDTVILFANSPPARMTVSGQPYASRDKLSNLRRDMYQQYAEYLADIAEHFKNNEKIHVSGISAINEPQWDWDKPSQEGCHYEPKEAAMITQAVIHEFTKRRLDVKIEAVESGRWERLVDMRSSDPEKSPIYVNTLFSLSSIKKNLDSYALHSYWSNRNEKRAFAEYFYKKYPGKKIHMTEWCQMTGRRDTGMDSALVLANEIVDDLVAGNVSSWQYWIAVSKYNYHDGLIYVNERDKEIIETRRLWVMGNFSRFIRPGYKRINASADSDDLNIVAAVSPDHKKVVLAAVNSQDLDLSFQVSVDGVDDLNMYCYLTDEQNTLNRIMQEPGTLFSIPARSVVTFVYEK